MAVESTAEAYLELLAARGIDDFFANGGTDFGPISEPQGPVYLTLPREVIAEERAGFTSLVSSTDGGGCPL